jgi:hypothetical protein
MKVRNLLLSLHPQVIIFIYKHLIFSNMDKTSRVAVRKELQKDVVTEYQSAGIKEKTGYKLRKKKTE